MITFELLAYIRILDAFDEVSIDSKLTGGTQGLGMSIFEMRDWALNSL